MHIYWRGDEKHSTVKYSRIVVAIHLTIILRALNRFASADDKAHRIAAFFYLSMLLRDAPRCLREECRSRHSLCLPGGPKTPNEIRQEKSQQNVG